VDELTYVTYVLIRDDLASQYELRPIRTLKVPGWNWRKQTCHHRRTYLFLVETGKPVLLVIDLIYNFPKVEYGCLIQRCHEDWNGSHIDCTPVVSLYSREETVSKNS
jgi:hypothetical protein